MFCRHTCGAEPPPYLGLVVLQPVGLVHHQAGPCDRAQDGLVDGDQLVGRQQNVELNWSVFLQTEKHRWNRDVCGAVDTHTSKRRQTAPLPSCGTPYGLI